MDDSSNTDSDALSVGPTVSSILGIKGPLRFRPHGSSQKAHVVLRRVEISDDLSDDGEINHLVYFSLFAQKRIEVKPGKEILLTVASPDGRFKDQAIIFEGNLADVDEMSDGEDDTQVAEEEEELDLPPLGEVIPPKMRRAWTKRNEDVSPVIQNVSVAQPSVGVQAEPILVSSSVQAQPKYIPASVQARPPYVSVSIQTHSPPPPHISATARDTEAGKYISSDMQTDEVPLKQEIISTLAKQQELPRGTEEGWEKERSLSPMELDSPTNSPGSPIFSPTAIPESLVRLSSPTPSPRSPASSIASSSGAQDVQESPVDGKSAPLQPPPLLPHCSPRSTKYEDLNHHENPQAVVVPSRPGLSPYPTSSVTTTKCLSLSLPPKVLVPAPRGQPPVADMFHLDVAPENPPSRSPSFQRPATATPAVCDQFTSAGFVTGFVGKAVTGVEAKGTSPVKSEGRPKPDMKSVSVEPSGDIPLATVSPPKRVNQVDVNLPRKSDSNPISVAPDHYVLRQTAAHAPSPVPHPSSPAKHSDLQSHNLAIPQNAVASSSKILLERPAPVPPTAPRSLASISSRAKEKSPTLTSVPVNRPVQTDTSFKSIPSTISSTYSTSRTYTTTTRSSPPPAPKSLAYITSGPLSNPLNIRPSSNPVLQKAALQRAPPTAPKVMTQAMAQTPAKKRVIVGSGWPLVRQPNGVPTGSSGSTLTPSPSSQASKPQADPPPLTSLAPPPPPTATYHHPVKSPTLSNIVPYSSPSPPPSSQANPTQSLTSKWKAISTQICSPKAPAITVHQRDPPYNAQPKSSVIVGSESQSMPLKDRISTVVSSPSSPIQEPTAQGIKIEPVCDLLSRISSQAASSSSARLPAPQEPPPPTTTKKLPPQTHTPSPLPQPLNHPLPPKPIQTRTASRGKKRERPQSPDIQDSRRKRTFKWPTTDSIHSIGLKGEGDLGICGIAFNSDGSQFVLRCSDRTIRIWNNQKRREIARLSHNAAVVSVAWMDGDAGIVSLADDGMVSKWTRTGQNHWQWAKILDVGNERRADDESICLAYVRDRIAVAFPHSGVKVWVWCKGTWQPQRSILRQNVTAIRFIEDGEALLGGTRDGVLWYCEIPNGTLRAYAFLKSKMLEYVKISCIDVNATGNYTLIQAGSCAHLVGIRQADNKGNVEQVYSNKDTEARTNTAFGAVFASRGQAILFGSLEGCVLVWDQKKGSVVYGLEHGEDDLIQAVASFDDSLTKDGCLVTGTKQGQLTWWSQPVARSQLDDSHKRIKLGAS